MTPRAIERVRSLARARRLLPAVAALCLAALGVQSAFAAGPTLRSVADGRGVKIGSALAANHLSADGTYASIAAAQFNSVTPENEMKWGVVEPNARGQFNWSGADQIVSFAQSHGQRIRGHNLVWHSQLPGWLTGGNFSAAQVTQIMQQHIATEVGRYRGRVAQWDVVNEPFNDNGTLRSDIFTNAMGSGYIATALRAARAADPNAKLFLNDFNIEAVNTKSNAMLNLVKSLKSQGVPIDGIGFESHFILGQIPSTLQQNIARFTAAGVAVEITELDVRMTLPTSSTKLSQQANDYRTVINACLAVSGCRAITVWEFTDKYSWVPSTFSGQGAADLYDQNLQTKPAYTAVQQAL
ncbi:MAG TPA: endo-1,4-beta-xylanase [Candidatus Dormibacteraeota bacterium]